MTTYQNNSLAPSAGPLATNERDPISLPPVSLANVDFRIDLQTQPEIQFQGRHGNLQGTGNVTLGEGMEKIVGRDRVLHHIQVGRAFQQVLTLPAGVLRAHLLAIDTLHRQALLLVSTL